MRLAIKRDKWVLQGVCDAEEFICVISDFPRNKSYDVAREEEK
jgi:hypothetical protein